MTKAEFESKSLAELHALAAQAGVPRYRLLARAELIEKLAGEDSSTKPARSGRGDSGRRRQRERKSPASREPRRRAPRRREEVKAEEAGAEDAVREEPQPPATRQPSIAAATTPPPASPRRKRRRRRWGRRRKGLHASELLIPAAPARRTVVYGETREGCTALLRGLAAELASDRGPDPIALLVDPSPEELADWKREAPQAEIVAAGQDRHVEDALAQAVRRAEGGEEVVLMVDSLSRLEDTFGDSELARELLGGGRDAPEAGTLAVVAAFERRA